MQKILLKLTLANSFIEESQGPNVIITLYDEVQNYVERRLHSHSFVTEEDFAQIQCIIAALGATVQPAILELGLIKEGELNEALTNQILEALEKFHP